MHWNYEIMLRLGWIIYWYETAFRAAYAQWILRRSSNGSLRHILNQIDTHFYADSIVPYESSLRKLAYTLLTASAVVVTMVTGYSTFCLLKHTDKEVVD
jgi:hypothetical protein